MVSLKGRPFSCFLGTLISDNKYAHECSIVFIETKIARKDEARAKKGN